MIFSFIFAFLFVQNIPVTTTSSVTYPGIGTFHSSDFFHSIYRLWAWLYLPKPPAELTPTFTLFTRSNPQLPETLTWNSTTDIQNSKYFNPALNTKIIIHGFLENHGFIVAKWMNKMKNHLLVLGDFNVILVDWSKGNLPPYFQAAVNARVVGPMISIQIQAICSVFPNEYSPTRFHIIGHSLGAQVAGYAGKFLNGTLGQITGLDPAGPSFEGLPPEAHLWYSDATFVDVLHTHGQAIFGFGFWEPIGDADVYLNGGRTQPGCGTGDRVSRFSSKGFIDGVRTLVACDHMRAVDYYTEALTPDHPPSAFQCENYADFQAGKYSDCGALGGGEKCLLLGLRSIEYTNGSYWSKDGPRRKFWVNTNENEPFFKG